MYKVIFFVLMFLCVGGTAIAASTSHEGKIKEVWVFSDNWGTYTESNNYGIVGIYMDPPLPKGCGTGDIRVAVSSKHPIYKSVLSTALAAKALGATVQVYYLDTCTVRSNSWDFGFIKIK